MGSEDGFEKERVDKIKLLGWVYVILGIMQCHFSSIIYYKLLMALVTCYVVLVITIIVVVRAPWLRAWVSRRCKTRLVGARTDAQS